MDGQDEQDKRLQISNLKSQISSFFILHILPIHVDFFVSGGQGQALPLQLIATP
jgi:hypothetical protein